jgi:hypothetical protein
MSSDVMHILSTIELEQLLTNHFPASVRNADAFSVVPCGTVAASSALLCRTWFAASRPSSSACERGTIRQSFDR